tara:strand:+ start:1189 stop:1821 length:633 start_codon:yes stop_codon:yes gene_type:complete
MNCVVCESTSIEIFDIIDQKKYWKCSDCLAKFMDKACFLDPIAEKTHYLTHQNNITDLRYRNFLSRLANPLKAKISKTGSGLDYGCGHGPALVDMLRSDGFTMDLYDPFFFPHEHILSKKYDFISCTETVEHFFNPSQEFFKLDSLLKKDGWLGIMTCFMTEDQFFKNWYYRRDPTHVTFYCEQTFKVIAQKYNWTHEVISKDIVLMQKN